MSVPTLPLHDPLPLYLGTPPVTPPAQVFGLATLLTLAADGLVVLAIGFILQIAFAAPLIAGEIIGNSMGIGFASIIDPQTGRSSAALSNFLSTMLTLLFLSVNGHLILVDKIGRAHV